MSVPSASITEAFKECKKCGLELDSENKVIKKGANELVAGCISGHELTRIAAQGTILEWFLLFPIL